MKRICKLCGKEFETKSSRRNICYDEHYHKCPICQKDVLTTDLYHRDTCCSTECSRKLANAVMKVRYDKHPAASEEAKQKRRKTMIAKYGVDNLFKSKQFQESIKEENTKRLDAWKHEKDSYENTCRVCGNKFQTPIRTRTVCPNCETVICEVCGKEFEKQWPYTQTTCSGECRMKSLRAKGMKDKICPLCSKKFVPNSPRQKYCKGPHYRTCIICGKQFKITFEYNPTQTCSKECKEIFKRQNFKQTYGVENPMQIEQFKKKMAATNMERYGMEYYTSQNFRNATISKQNKQFGDLLHKYNVPYTFEKQIKTLSYDICLADDNILIEIDPTYTHNAIGNHWSSSGIAQDYHKIKSKVAEENSFRCIHIFDWDNWDDIIHQIISPKEYADECKCKVKFDYFKSNTNLETGEGYGEALIQLHYNNKPIQEMKFVKKQNNINWTIEYMKRKCDEIYCKEGYRLMFNCFLANLSNSIDAYCDLAKEDQKEYENIGMKLVDIINPIKIWSKGTETKESHFGDDEEMLTEGWLPVYNCGYAHYKYERF